MKIFISTPMNGLTDDQIKATFKRVREEVSEQLCCDTTATQTVSNAIFGKVGRSRLQMLGHSISLLDTVDAIIFTTGFTKASGCLIEYHVVNEYGDTWAKDPTKPNVYFEMPDGTLKEATNRLERHRCFMMDQMND
jgi:uncharacterized protein YktB (UPF0637 family)